jgi:UDP-N-acetylmuramoyl-tripeptide--D-alanyl-D-alanine ligase
MAGPDQDARAPAPEMTVGEVARLVGGQVEHGAPGATLRGVAIDSRVVATGMLFVALPGTQTDGHRFIDQAFRRGAGAALVSQPLVGVSGGAAVIRVPDTLRAFHRLARAVRDRRPLRVVGVTGSVGKTSTKEMAAAVAAQAFRTARSPENWNTEIGIPLVLANLPEDREVAVLEMAMRGPGQIRELVEIAGPEIGVVTNVGESHLDFFPSREALAAEKGELIEGLSDGGCAILNVEDPLVWELRHRTRARILSFGLSRGDVRAEDTRPLPGRGSLFRLVTPGGAAPVTLRVPGRHAVQNALAAAAVGLALGLDAEAIAAGLAQVAPLPMRLETFVIGGTVLLSDVYNSSPMSVFAALDAMDEVPGEFRVTVLGDMRELGTHTVEAHRRVGREIARRRIDVLVAFGPLAVELAAAAREAGGTREARPLRVVHTERVDEVVDLLRRMLAPSSVVLLKGSRAMAMERIAAALLRPEPTGASAGGGNM